MVVRQAMSMVVLSVVLGLAGALAIAVRISGAPDPVAAGGQSGTGSGAAV
jgi:hypothetical protein